MFFVVRWFWRPSHCDVDKQLAARVQTRSARLLACLAAWLPGEDTQTLFTVRPGQSVESLGEVIAAAAATQVEVENPGSSRWYGAFRFWSEMIWSTHKYTIWCQFGLSCAGHTTGKQN